jgi:hypothetical protein
MVELTLEQQLEVEKMKLWSKEATTYDLKSTVMVMYTNSLYMDNYYKEVLKAQWGIGNDWTDEVDESKG